MANADHLELLQQGVDAWNAWRAKEPSIEADLFEANLSGADLSGTNLSGANLFGANLIRANLFGANLHRANLFGADLSGAYLRSATLIRANLSGANLREANLFGADFQQASLVKTDLSDADLTGCRIYGVSAWGLKLSDETKQRNLIITTNNEPEITVDDIEVAQFVYLLLNNTKIRNVIDTITSKAVLILGRFTPERKKVLDALREELRQRNRTPIVFDFNGPRSKNTTDTVKLLAQMARYVIVDLSDPNSAPYELGVISMLGLETTPVVPIIVSSQKPFPMLDAVLQ